MLEAVTIREIEAIFQITDGLGISREMLIIPLRPRHPGQVRRTPSGKLEIVVESEGEFATFLASLAAEIGKAMGPP